MNTEINENIFNSFPNLESERLTFREFSINDAEDFFYIRSHTQVMDFMDSRKHTSVKDSENEIIKIQQSFKEKSGLNWAIVEKSSSIFIGYFGYWRLIPGHCRGEIGYALKPESWGRGYMAETFDTLIPFGFKDLHLHSIEANVNPHNVNSIKVLKKFGFKKEAFFRENYLFEGEFKDSVIYCLLESDL